MRTIDISPEDMEKRVSRFRDLKPLRAAESLDIPQEAKDVIYSRELLSVIGLDDAADTPVNQGAPIQGAGGITMTHAKCPPGTGPSLHAHQQTYETFTVLRGRFEVTWNDDGAHRVELEFRPRSWRLGAHVSAGSWSVLVIFSLGWLAARAAAALAGHRVEIEEKEK